MTHLKRWYGLGNCILDWWDFRVCVQLQANMFLRSDLVMLLWVGPYDDIVGVKL